MIIRKEFKEDNYIGHIWKDVIGYEGIYKVSQFGVMRSISRLIKKGKRTYITKDYVMNPNKCKGYLLINLQKDRIKQVKSVHIIVAEVFVLNPSNKPFVNHKNGIKDDNNMNNLEWVTHQENCIHAAETGLYIPRKGSQLKNSKFIEDDIVEIRELFYEGEMSKKELAKIYNVTPQCINQIVTKKSWHHI